VDLLGALANPSWEVRRLLKLAKGWPTVPRRPTSHVQVVPVRTARQLHASEIDRLVAAHSNGATVRALAKQFGIHRSTVGRHLHVRSIDTRPPGLSSEDLATAAELYRSGWSLAKIADKFGVAGDTVRRRLREIGVRMRGPHERTR